jgi:hypothetical protein
MLRGLLTGCLAIPVLFGAAAHAQMGGGEFNIGHFCDTKSPRQTIVYVDDTLMTERETQWAEQIVSKLKSNLMPSEPLAVVRLSPATGNAKEIWKGCFPDYSAGKRAELSEGGFISLFKEDPLKVLSKQQDFFRASLGGALGAVLREGARSPSAVKVDPANPPDKQLVRSLSNDIARFDRARGNVRAIIYSDMLENSDLGKALESDPDVAAKAAGSLGINFQNATVYAYGVASTLPERNAATDKAKVYWTRFFHAANANVAGFGSDLIVTSSIPVGVFDYEMEFKLPGNEKRPGRMQLFVDRDGQLQDSYVAAGTVGRSLLKGEFVCNGNECSMSAIAPTTVLLRVEGAASEEFKLQGDRDDLKGTIAIPGAKIDIAGTEQDAVFEITAKRVK